jgi:hypothetical protein
MNFNDPKLVKKYGNWIRVQVAFYDYLFFIGTNLCAAHWKEKARAGLADGFADGEDLYESSIKGIERAFSSPEDAWERFVQNSLS